MHADGRRRGRGADVIDIDQDQDIDIDFKISRAINDSSSESLIT
jgi:hypothetical protein